MEAGMTRVAARSGAVLALFTLAFSAPPAHAQFNALGPAFSKLNGALIWGSLGYRDTRHPERFYVSDRHPAVRGGFAALYGPFGGQPDTTVTLDSVRTMVEWEQIPARSPGATRVDTVRAVRTVHSRHTIPGRDGWVSLAVGYEYSGAYRVDMKSTTGTLAATFPVGGFYATAYFGPFPVWRASRALFWYAGLGAGLVQLSDANGLSDTTLVRFNTERALAPEASLLLGWRVHRGVRVLGGVSAQHIRWSAIRYRAPSEQPLPDAALRLLPDGLRLTTVHAILGVGFDASELFAR
jgi:hypothetical protein